MALRADGERGAESAAVALYLSHHVDVLDDAGLEECFGTADPEAIDLDRLLARLYLRRIGVYPHNTDASLVLDYVLGQGATDYLLAVSFDASGEVAGIEMES